MGLFGLFGSKSAADGVRKHAERLGNKRAQAPDRWDSIKALAAMKTPEAVEALLVRFTIYSDPSITDQEEKDYAFQSICDAKEVAIAPVRAFMTKADSLGWPLKIFDKLLPEEGFVSEMLDYLARLDTEYERDPEKKLQVLGALEERRDPRIVDAVSRFFEDVNESVRFMAVGAALAQAPVEGSDLLRDALAKLLVTEDSLRIRTRVLDAFAERGWSLAEIKDRLAPPPSGYIVDAKGIVKKPAKR